MTDPGRGQTTHDFALGISVFILASVFVLTFVPSVTAPYTEGVSEVEQEHARTVSRVLVGNLSTAESPTTFDDDRTVDFFTSDWGETGLQERFAVGSVYRDQSVATTVRLVRYDDQPFRMEVRVW